MYYIVFCTDKPDQLETRKKIRQEHRRYLRANHAIRVIQGGPTLDAEAHMNGTALVVEAEHIEQVQEFLDNDPYSKAHIFARTEIRPWQAVEITQGERI